MYTLHDCELDIVLQVKDLIKFQEVPLFFVYEQQFSRWNETECNDCSSMYSHTSEQIHNFPWSE